MNYFTTPNFWASYEGLPKTIQALANKNFEFLKQNPRHPSLHFKKVGHYWSARVGDDHRVVAVEIEQGLLWFWIGLHDEYERIIRN
jgi:Txe/YoeB family toxin of Txe-Axe toxin-antitoxin module